MLLSKDLDDMKLNIHKIQCVLPAGGGERRFAGNRYYKDGTEGKSPDPYRARKTGRDSDNFTGVSSGVFEMIPLSLEEIFISETEVAGYDIKRLVFLNI